MSAQFFLRICAKFVLLNAKQETQALFMIWAQFYTILQIFLLFMAFEDHSSAQNCQLDNLAAQKNLLLEGLVDAKYIQLYRNFSLTNSHLPKK